MKRRTTQLALFSLACFGMVLAPIAAYSYGNGQTSIPRTVTAKKPAVKIHNITLGVGSSLRGQLVSGNGQALPGQQVVLLQGGRKIAKTQSDASGRFSFSGVKPGTYTAVSKASKSAQVVQVWGSQVAPPNAAPQALMVAGDTVVRGQFDPTGTYEWFEERPILGYAAITTAIVTPIVLIARKKNS